MRSRLRQRALLLADSVVTAECHASCLARIGSAKPLLLKIAAFAMRMTADETRPAFTTNSAVIGGTFFVAGHRAKKIRSLSAHFLASNFSARK